MPSFSLLACWMSIGYTKPMPVVHDMPSGFAPSMKSRLFAIASR